jgi:outer membrane protein OmpA-like peptidoglycan-associated protein
VGVLEDNASETDDGFGPGSDLVLSFLGVIILLIGTMTVTGIPRHAAPPEAPKVLSPLLPESAPKAVEPQNVAEQPQNATDAKRRISELEAQIARMSRRVVAFRFDGTNTAFFEQSSSELSEPAQKLIDGAMLSIGRKVLESEANQIEIVGYASPEPSSTADHDTNLDLSSARAEAVAHYLARRGVPYECMNVRGVGRGRSDLLYDMFLARRPGSTLRQWDAMFTGPRGRDFMSSVESDLASERRVEIVTENDADSKCSRRRLLQALGV